MAKPGDLSSKKVKNTYTGIVQHDGGTSRLYDGTGSRVVSIDVTRITASKASIINITDLAHLTASKVQVDTHLSVSGSTVLGDNCNADTVKIVGNTWLTGSLTVSGSCEGSFRSIGQAKFIYLDNPVIEDQKPARVTRGEGFGQFNVPRFGGENAALDVYGNVVITGSLIVQDTIWAQEFHSEVVSQSIIYTSGSTKFGGDWNDTMTVTGSIFQSGSDAYFLNGVGIGTTGSNKAGAYTETGQDTPVEFTHLLRIDDPGHDGLQHKNSKLIYGTFGSPNAAHVSASDVIRFRDKTQGDDVFVISSVSQSVFFSTNDKYNVGIGVPSGSNSKVDENLVVSSSTNARIKIESAHAEYSASLYLESGRGVWELAVQSMSNGLPSANGNNQLSESLVFRTRNSRDIKNTFGANGTFTEALRLNSRGRAGFNIPSANHYDYPQQVQVSGSINIIQGRTRNINAGTFHDKDGLNGIFFNNQKMIYVSGSGPSTSMFFGVSAGGQDAATGGEANIAIGYQTAFALTTGDFNTLIGLNAGKLLVGGSGNVFMGSSAGAKTTDGANNVGIGTNAFRNSTGGGQYNIAIGDNSIGAGDTSGNDNIAIGRLSLEDTTTGFNNVSIGHQSLRNLTTADKNIAIGSAALGLGIVTGNDNIAVGSSAGQDMTSGADNILLGNLAGTNLTDNVFNIAIGHDSLATSANDGDKNIAIGFESMATGDVSGEGNVAIGSQAAKNITTAVKNVFIGDNAGGNSANISGTYNTVVGRYAGLNLTQGGSNVLLGNSAALDLTTGMENIAIGSGALANAVGSDRNIAIGSDAISGANTTGDDNIGLGTSALDNLTAGGSNIAVGSGSMGIGVVTGNDNIALGNFALEDVTSGGNNIAVGSGSAASVTNNIGNIALGFESFNTSANDGDKNVAIGYQAMKTGDVSGDQNIAIGEKALEDLTSGTDNVAIGTSAGLNLTTAGHTVAIGTHAMASGVTTGGSNVAIGYQSGYSLTAGEANIFLGVGSGKSATTHVNNIAIGNEAFITSAADADNNIAIGTGAMKAGNVTGDNNIAIGELSLDDITTGADNVAIGSSAGLNLTTGGNNIAIGHDSMAIGIITGNLNIAIGERSLLNAAGAENNIALGNSTLRAATDTAARNIAIGEGAAYSGAFTGLDNIILGTTTAKGATSLAENVIIGHRAVYVGVMTGDNNTIVGSYAAENITSGTDNVIVGSNAGSDTLTTNTSNILIGLRPSASAGLDNAYAIGNQALVTQANSMVLGGQTGEKFNIGIGGITAPNATLEVSGTMNITGSLTVSGSSTFTNIGRALLVANEAANTITAANLPTNRVLEVSGTSNFRGNTHVTGNLYVTDTIFAQEFHTEYVSASITFTSGSHKFGDSNNDNQMMTGSLRVTGSGNHYIMGRQNSSGGSDGVNNAKVGINTMTPTYELDVAGNIGLDEYIYHNGDDNTNIRFIPDSVFVAAGGSNNVMLVPTKTVFNGSQQDMDFNVQTDNDVNTIYVLGSNDMVGIGMDNPTKKLHVTGDGHFTTDLTVDGDTTLGNAITDKHIFTGHVTMSSGADISGSMNGTITAGSYRIGGSAAHPGDRKFATPEINDVNGITIGNAGQGNLRLNHITASGNISASGKLYGNTVHIPTNGNLYLDTGNTATQFITSDGTTLQLKSNDFYHVGNSFRTSGHITASGNVAALTGTGSFEKVQVRGPSIVNERSFVIEQPTDFNLDIRGRSETSPALRIRSQGGGLQNIIVSSSGNFIINQVTASGDISSSGVITGKLHTIDTSADIYHYPRFGVSGNAAELNVTNGWTFNPSNDTMLLGNSIALAGDTGIISTSGHITASGNISSSQVITSERLIVQNVLNDEIASFTSLEGVLQLNVNTNGVQLGTVTNHVTASGNISSSGNLIGKNIQANVSLQVQGNRITYENDDLRFLDSGLNVSPSVGIGHITASGNISSSGTVSGLAGYTQHNISTTTVGNGQGDIVKFGTGTSEAGKIYHFKSNGAWELANCTAVATSDGMLAVALGTDPDVDGMLVRGMCTLHTIQGTEAVGDVLYLSETATGTADSEAPAATDEVVRIIGYCLHASNKQIWFNPDNTFIELA